MWTRRELLRIAGAGTAAALLGCATRARPDATSRAGDLEAVRLGLRDAVEVLATRLRDPIAYAIARRRVRVLVDLAQRDVSDVTTIAIVVGGRDANGAWRERGLDRAEPALVIAAARALVAEAPMAAPVAVAPGPPGDLEAARLAIDPEPLGTADWLARAEAVARRAEDTASSRIVYRAAYVTCDDERSWVVTGAHDRSQRVVRTRIGATAVAWQGTAPLAGTAEIAGGFGPDPARLGDDALARASAEALALNAAGPVDASAAIDVVLAPPVVAAILDAAWARLAPGGPAAITDDPTLPGGYASYFFDDDGVTPAAIALAGPGVARGADLAAGRMRRSPPRWLRTRSPSNLVMATGDQPAAALEGQVDDGLVIEGVADLRGDGDAIALRATRARGLARGRRTGESWRDVELRGSAAAIVAAIRAVGDRAETIAPVDDERPARALVVPWALTRAAIGPARGGG